MPHLGLGPLLRYVGEDEATIWVETDAPCEVEVLGHTARTFHVEGHHYAVVCIEGLEPGSATEYEVRLDGKQVWPDPEFQKGFPPSVIRTLTRDHPIKLVFGSCRVACPHEPPHSLSKDDADTGRERDALYALALRMRDESTQAWPHVLFLCGDQVYADEVSPGARQFIEQHRDTSKEPHDQVANF